MCTEIPKMKGQSHDISSASGYGVETEVGYQVPRGKMPGGKKWNLYN